MSGSRPSRAHGDPECHEAQAAPKQAACGSGRAARRLGRLCVHGALWHWLSSALVAGYFEGAFTRHLFLFISRVLTKSLAPGLQTRGSSACWPGLPFAVGAPLLFSDRAPSSRRRRTQACLSEAGQPPGSDHASQHSPPEGKAGSWEVAPDLTPERREGSLQGSCCHRAPCSHPDHLPDPPPPRGISEEK